MTQEEKNLLLTDLCGRLPYGFTIYRLSDNANIKINDIDDFAHFLEYSDGEEFKPYLRPMSSMTEEEIEEYRNLSDEVIGSYGPYHHEFTVHCVRLGIKPDNPHECVDDFLNMEAIDWLNKKGFDYRELIPMGLALEALEGMYKI